MNKSALVVTPLLIMLFVSSAVAKKELPPGAGVDVSVPTNVLLAVDNSSSMNGNVSGPRVPNDPQDIAIDSKGRWHVAQSGAKPVRQYASAKKWTKDYGSPHQKGGWDRARIAFDVSGSLYLTDYSDSLIHKFDSEGNFVKSISTPWPRGIDLDTDGNIYVTGDSAKYKGPWMARRLDSDGNVLNEWTVGPNCHGCYPHGISVLQKKGQPLKVYIVSKEMHSSVHEGKYSRCKRGYPVRVYRHNETTDKFNEERKWFGMGADDIEVTQDSVYTLGEFDSGSEKEPCGGHVGKYSHDGAFKKRFGPPFTQCPDPNQLYRPIGLGSDLSGNIYVVGGKWGHMSYVKQYDSDGKILSAILPSNSRMNIIKCVLHRLLRNKELNQEVNYGLLVWSQEAKMAVRVSPSGAEEIIPMLCDSSYCGIPYDFLVPRSGTTLESGMRLAEDYFENRAVGFIPGPIDSKIPCQNQLTIVLSDGRWGNGRMSESIAKRILESTGVQTAVVGFALSDSEEDRAQDNYVNLSKKGGTFPYSPMFTDDEVKLQEALEFLVRRGSRPNLVYTGTTPTIDSGSGNYIYQSTFTIPESGQWQGKVTKFDLNSVTGRIGDVVWEAGNKLNQKPAKNRKIWTVLPGSVGEMTNNFKVENASALKSALYQGSGNIPTESQAKALIQFVRGLDSYDEDADSQINDERGWKLADVYHSEMAIVGPPVIPDSELAENPNSEANYKKITGYEVFVRENMSRTPIVYAGANSGMLHAFNDNTGEELWAFIPPNILSSLREMTTSVANTTIPIYGVDGSPVVKDVFLRGQWRTVLMAGLGRGGQGYFALDVTVPETPKFLFAFANDSANSVIRYWDPSGRQTEQNHRGVSAEFNYSKLGETWSTPTMFSLADGLSRKWIASIGDGVKNGAEDAATFYAIDLEQDGKVLKLIKLVDTPGGFTNSVPGQVSAITADTTKAANYKGALAYFTDIEGKLFKVNLSDRGRMYDTTELFDAEGNTVNQRASFMPVTTSTDGDDKVWAYFGTGNLKKEKVHLSLSTIQNRIFGIKDQQFPNFSSVGKSTISSLNNVTSKGGMCPGEDDLGWYIDLKRDEKVTNKLAISQGVLTAPLYTPDTAQVCFPGTSALTEIGYKCGNTRRRTALGSGQVTGVRVFNNKVYAGISGIPAANGDTEIDLENEFKLKGNIVSGSPVTPESGGSSTLTVESWRERY